MLLLLTILSSCAAFRSDVKGLYNAERTFSKREKVTVFFDFYHQHQAIGYDAIPKLMWRAGIDDFDDILQESLKELSNIKSYNSFTNRGSQVDNLNQRKQRLAFIDSSDYHIKIEILRTKSFAKHFLGILVSTFSVDLIPIGYTWNYNFKVTVIHREEGIVGMYERSANVTEWHQILLLPLYPFHTERLKNEEIFYKSLKNIFMEIENRNILNSHI